MKHLDKNLMVLIILGACSTAKVRTFPGEDGTVEVDSRDLEKDGAEEAAVKEASRYCETQGKRPYFMNGDRDAKYTGQMEEEKRNTIRKASRAAMIVGPTLGVASHYHAIGGLVGGAGAVGTVMTNDRDYESKLKFRCQ
jgi:hypothetical protein